MSQEISPSVDTYFTIQSPLRTEIKIKGSRFIGSAIPSTNKEIATVALESIRKEFFDATHNCFAYRFGAQGLEFRTADDGEPNGSAGKPILFSIQKAQVSDILVVVTRYFGGTKLGIGGLARAYSESATDVLSKCEIVPVHRTTAVKVFCTYEDVNVVKQLIEKSSIHFEQNYMDAVEFTAFIPQSQVENFTNSITSFTNARAGTIILSEKGF
ncbi:MAG TPA: YigZ family protein [Patescibacteria group bacterium]|nr:YigZ family protein [Patescibacteria group bacterium]